MAGARHGVCELAFTVVIFLARNLRDGQDMLREWGGKRGAQVVGWET
jgi:hypothetical protein